MKTIRLIFTISFVLSAASLMAQNRHFNTTTLGMGGGGTAFIDGYHSNFVNPANLMVNNTGRKPKNELGIAGGIGINATGDFLNLSVYDTYLTKGLLIEGTVRENMLSEWFGDDAANTRDLGVTLDIVPLGYSHRGKNSAFSLAIRSRTIQDFNVNRGFMDLAFYGLDSEVFGTGQAVDFGFDVVSYTEISVGYAMELPIPLTGLVEKLPFINGINVYAGVAPKYIIGMQALSGEVNSTLTANSTSLTHEFDYTLQTYGDLSTSLNDFAVAYAANPDDAVIDDYLSDYSGSDVGTLGSGFGVDMGITAELDVSLPALGFLGKRQVLRVSMSATDLGSITYKENPKAITANGGFTWNGDTGDEEIDDYLTTFSDSLKNDVYGGFTSEQTEDKKYSLPGMYNFGASLSLGKLTTTMDYGVGFNDLGRNSKISRLTLGAEYRLFNFIPIRVGTRIGGGYAAAYSAGFGLDFRYIDLTFAASAVNTTADKGTTLGVAMSGLVIRF